MKDFELRKVVETVAYVRHAAPLVDLFVDYGGWKVIDTGGGEVLLALDENLPFGRVRFIEMPNKTSDEPHQQMRPSARIYDTGGIADIDIRVKDIWQIYHDLTAQGWFAMQPPQHLPTPPPFQLLEMLMTEPKNGLTIAFVERHAPPLQLPEDKRFGSHSYLSALVVKDLERSTHFYVHTLGFQLANDMTIRFDADSENNFAIPHNYADAFTTRLHMYTLDGTRDTMLESIRFEGLTGFDFSERCVFPHLGWAMFRIEVKNLANYHQFVQQKGATVADIAHAVWQPLGAVSHFEIRSPDGVLLSFFEKI